MGLIGVMWIKRNNIRNGVMRVIGENGVIGIKWSMANGVSGVDKVNEIKWGK